MYRKKIAVQLKSHGEIAQGKRNSMLLSEIPQWISETVQVCAHACSFRLEMYSLSSFQLDTMLFFNTEVLPVIDGRIFSTDQEEPYVENEVPEEANPEIERQ